MTAVKPAKVDQVSAACKIRSQRWPFWITNAANVLVISCVLAGLITCCSVALGAVVSGMQPVRVSLRMPHVTAPSLQLPLDRERLFSAFIAAGTTGCEQEKMLLFRCW